MNAGAAVAGVWITSALTLADTFARCVALRRTVPRGPTRALALSVLAISLLAVSLLGCNDCPDWGEDPWVPGEVVVVFAADVTREEVDRINSEIGARATICYPVHYCTISLPAGVGISDAMCFYDHHPRVRVALPNSYVSRSTGGP